MESKKNEVSFIGFSKGAPYDNIELHRDDNQHEQIQLKENHNYELEKQKNSIDGKRKISRDQLGLIGILFGGKENASRNITAIICILLLIGASVVSCAAYFKYYDTSVAIGIWPSVAPIITLSLGYLFGKHESGEK